MAVKLECEPAKLGSPNYLLSRGTLSVISFSKTKLSPSMLPAWLPEKTFLCQMSFLRKFPFEQTTHLCYFQLTSASCFSAEGSSGECSTTRALSIHLPIHDGITNTAKVINNFNCSNAGFHIFNRLSAVAGWTDHLSLPR